MVDLLLLCQAGHEVALAVDGQDAMEQLAAREPDLLILDWMMPHVSGVEVCALVKKNPFTSHIPVLMLTARSEIQSKVEGFEAGADDYLGKPFEPFELVMRVAALLRASRQASERNPTSGLPGGRIIQDEMTRRVAQNQNFAVLYIDLTNFKPFADNFGFVIADALIAGVGRALRESVEACGASGDFAGHIGGDDFIIVAARENIESIAREARLRYAAVLAQSLDAQTMRENTFTGVDREGLKRDFPLPGLLCIALEVEPEKWISADHLGAFAAEMKRRARGQEDGVMVVGSV